MRFKTRDLVYLAVFGALWGAIEVTSGAVLHVVKLPFAGVFLTAIGIAIALIGRLFVPRRGSILFIGLVTAFLKMFSLGGIVVSPMIAIVAESLLAEIAVSALGKPRRLSFIAAGGLATFWSLIHPFFTQGILAGSGIATVYGWTIERGARLLGMDASAVLMVLAALIAIHILLGVVAGWVAWDAGKVIEARLQAPLNPKDAA
jgi:hypothetical protein